MADLGPLREWGAKSRLMMDPSFTNLLGGAAVGNPNLQRRPPILPTQMLPQPAMPQAPSVLREPLPMEGRLSFLPAMVTPERGREWALPGVLAGAWNAFTAPGRALQGQELGPEEALNVAGTAMLGGMPVPKPGAGGVGLNVFHGSRHKFDKFDMSKIGTGEGAQAYGHGLYFAEAPGVAKSYQMTGNVPGFLDMKRYQLADEAWTAAKGDKKAAISYLTEKAKNAGSDTARQQIYDAANNLDTLIHNRPGHLYKVDLPDEQIAKMLDWDKPLSQQPELLGAITKLVGPNGQPERWTGREAYDAVKNMFNTAGEASAYLKAQGVPGIRYLDQGSRGPSTIYNVGAPRADFGPYSPFTSKADAQKHLEMLRSRGFKDAEIKLQEQPQTSNFVVFSDEIPKILERK